MRMPDAIRNDRTELEEEEWNPVKESLHQALRQVNSFRLQEGESLDKDLRERIATISARLADVEKLEGERITRIRERIGNNLSDFIGKEGIDENRFEQELIFYMEKLDISEEKVRLANHLQLLPGNHGG